jgi:Tol biopolymer transport system component
MNRRLVTAVVASAVLAASAVPSGAGGYPRPGAYTQVDLTNAGKSPSGYVSHTSMSSDGRFVAFDSDAALTPGTGAPLPGSLSPPSNVFIRDLGTGRTVLASRAIRPGQAHLLGQPPGADFFDDAESYDPSISADGRYVAFTSAAPLVTGDNNTVAGIYDVFVFDRIAQRTTRVSVDSQGKEANSNSYLPSISGGGRYVSFTSRASNLVPGDTNSAPDVFVHDLRTGATVRVSVSSSGDQADGCALSLPIPSTLPVAPPCLLRSSSGDPSSTISANGRYVVFDELAANLVSGDTNGTWDVFVRDLKKGSTVRVSVASGGGQALSSGTDGSGSWPVGSTLAGWTSPLPPTHSISADGRYVVFISQAYNLIPNNTQQPAGEAVSGTGNDVYVHDVVTDRTYRVDVHPDGSECTNPLPALTLLMRNPSISPDGRYVSFSANNCGPTSPRGPAFTNAYDMFVYDRLTGQPDWVPLLTPAGQQYTGPNGRKYFGTHGESDLSAGGQYLSRKLGYSRPGQQAGADAFVWNRGTPLGVGNLAATGKLSVAGAPSFSATGVVTGAGTADLSQALTAQGADLTAATVTYRPRYGDLFARLELAQMPMFAVASPALVYGLRMTVNGTQYELRVAKGGPDALTSGGASFGLFRLTQGAWTKVVTLHGGYGTTGAEVTIALPLSDLGVQNSGHLSDVSAFAAAGSYDTGAAQLLDQVVLAGSSR